jgi:hypothetical protein
VERLHQGLEQPLIPGAPAERLRLTCVLAVAVGVLQPQTWGTDLVGAAPALSQVLVVAVAVAFEVLAEHLRAQARVLAVLVETIMQTLRAALLAQVQPVLVEHRQRAVVVAAVAELTLRELQVARVLLVLPEQSTRLRLVARLVLAAAAELPVDHRAARVATPA